MNNIIVRTLSGAVFITLILGSLYYGLMATIACFALVVYLGLQEFYNFFSASSTVSISTRSSSLIGTICFLLLASTFISPSSITPFFVILTNFILFANLLIELYRKDKQPILNLSVQYFGFFYLIVPFISMLGITNMSSNFTLMFLFLLIWTNDTFAFLSGKFFGKRKLFERISPKKTWEGTVGGILFTCLGAALISYFTDQNYFFWIVSVLVISTGAIFGDLLESLFKRSLKIKDSGNLIPGHGGILDRFDATLLAAPFFLCWLFIYDYFCA